MLSFHGMVFYFAESNPIDQALKTRKDRPVKSDVGKVDTTEVEMAFLINKKDHALVIKARLKRLSTDTTNIAVELHTELKNAIDKCITSITPLNG